MSIVTKGTNRKTGGLLRRHDSRFVVVPIVNPSYSSVENRIDYSIQAVLGQTVLHFDTKGIDLHRYQQNLLEDSSEAARIEEVSDGEVVTSGGRRYIEPPSRLSPEATPQQVQHHEQGLSPRVLTSAHMPQIHNALPRADSPTASPAVNRSGGNFSLQQSNAFRPQGRDRRLSPTTQQVSAKPENHYAHGDPPTNNPMARNDYMASPMEIKGMKTPLSNQEVQQAAVGQRQQQPIRQRVTQQHRQDDNATLSQAAAGEVPSRSPPLFSVPGGFGAHAKVPTKMRETITARYSPNQLNHKYANSPTLSHDPNSTNKEQTNYLDRAVPKANNDSRHYLADTSAKGAFNPDDHPTAQVTQQRHSYNPPTGHSSGTTEARERMKRIKTDPRTDYQAYTRPQGVSQQNNRKPPMSQLSKVDDNAGMYDEEDPSAIQTFGFDQAGDEYAIESIHSGFLNVGHEPESDGAGSTLFHHVEDEGFTDTNLGIEPDLASRKIGTSTQSSKIYLTPFTTPAAFVDHMSLICALDKDSLWKQSLKNAKSLSHHDADWGRVEAMMKNQAKAAGVVLTRMNELRQEFDDLEDTKNRAIKDKTEWTDRYGDAGTRLSDQCVDIQKSTRHLSGPSKKRRFDGFSSREATVASDGGFGYH